jgi:alkaline phosphatase D
MTLAAYRNRHALYKSDAHLQATHAGFPWVVVFDDHEVENNWAGPFDENGNPPDLFLPRRAQAFQACCRGSIGRGRAGTSSANRSSWRNATSKQASSSA